MDHADLWTPEEKRAIVAAHCNAPDREILGKGAFSVIYKIFFDGTICAVKQADQHENSRRYLRHEVRVLKALKPHGLKMIDYMVSKNGYIVYEQLHTNLYDMRHCLCESDIKKIADQLLEAIKEMHSCGIVHCDLKPENIMFSYDRTLKIIDFGNALFADELMTTKQTINTLYYRPPEYIIDAPLDYRVDYWAFGCIIMELLIKRVLFNPSRDNGVHLHANLMGQIILLFGNPSDEFIASGKNAHKYFDVKNNGVYLYTYLLGKPTSLYKLLRNYGYDRKTSAEWAAYLLPFFDRK